MRIWDWSEWCRQVVRGIQRFAHERPGWRLYVDVGQTTRPQVYSDDMRLDGIIAHVLSDVRGWRGLLDKGCIQAVGFSSSVPAALSDMPRVCVDDAKVADVIGRHLIAGGFRRFAYCGGSRRPSGVDARQQIVSAFATSHGYPCDVFVPSPSERPGAYLPSLTAFVRRVAKPVGIVTWNIDVARRVVQACARAGVAVPEQAGVVAWDDDPMLAETMEPTISAAVLPAERLGYAAAKLLDQVFAGVASSDPVVIEPSGVLRVRQSSDVSTLKDREVHLALQYIRENAAGAMNVPQVARHLGVSRKKLELDFARVAGQTPYEAILQARIELAKRLLLETDWQTSKVAAKSGMGDESTLRRWFLRRERMTPGAYRERYGSVSSRPRSDPGTTPPSVPATP